ncbi:hypothetical protein K491DRAFT_674180 [Lophiostoma macrostomum CBS 122681]|uniref:Mid2 domain-containing protein n=1 Tax=Lophiostoma macrostomum CBS 122681 TaxID=1314788 RepID=A0A6A6TQL1_9PLEO|nr:hypothetical protein K491DRAFT_674180 [Lophiostoma macrostomum CBS 122681]
MTMRAFLCSLLLAFFRFHSVITNCVYPDGHTIDASGSFPCHFDGTSTCCYRGWACMSNNMCKPTEFVGDYATTAIDNIFVRGSCTQATWENQGCASFCKSSSMGDVMSGPQAISDCPYDTPGRYYCENNITQALGRLKACKNASIYFEDKGPISTITIIGIPSSLYSFSTSPSTSISYSTSSTAPSTQPSPLPPVPPTTSPSLALPLGLGLGLPLSFLTLGILTYLCLRHRRQKNQVAGPTSESVMTPANTDSDQKAQRTPHWSMAATTISELPESNDVSRV